MESSKIGYWLQIGANIGILAGLILVGLQMRQNEELLRYQLLKQEGDSYVANEMAIAGEDYAGTWTRIHLDPYNVELKDMRVMESSLWGMGVYKWLNLYQLYEVGLVTEQQWKSAIDTDVSFAFGNPYGRGWWDAYLEGFSQDLPKDLREYADNQIRQVPLDATEKYFESIRHHTIKYQTKKE